MNFLKNKTTEDKIGIIFYILGLIYIGILTYIGLTKLGLWYDEIFSIGISQLPLNELMDLGTRDVHPLLYYFIFKGFIKIFAIFNFTDIVMIGKFLSILPFYLLFVLALTKVRENWGILTGGIFALCISSMPQLMLYGVEIRMYSLALFFITTSFIYMYEIIKTPNTKNWAILTILTICSAYTHYFSGVASFSLYFIFLVYILCYNRDLLKKWIISASIAILSFIPWLFIVFGQLTEIQGNYWIDPISLKTVISYVYYILSPANIMIKANELVNPTILGTLFLISLIILIIYYLRDKKEFKFNFALIGIAAFLMVPIIGISISLIHTPIFHHRYIIPTLGLLWLGISIILSKYYTKKEIFIPILVLILAIGMIGTINFINIENEEFKNTIEKKESLNNIIGEGNVIFYDSFPIYFELSTYYLKNNHHLTWHEDIINNIIMALEDPGIKNEIETGSKVYFVDSDESQYQEGIESGLIFEKKDITYTSHDIKEYEIYEIKVK